MRLRRSTVAEVLGRRDVADDSGGAIVEFVAVTLLLLVPVVYLVVTVARIQAGLFAAEAASYEAARASVVEGVWQLDNGASRSAAMDSGLARARAVTAVTAEDFGFDTSDAVVVLTCAPAQCLSFGSNIEATVEVHVPLPGVPGFVGRLVPLEVTVAAAARAPVDGLADDS